MQINTNGYDLCAWPLNTHNPLRINPRWRPWPAEPWACTLRKTGFLAAKLTTVEDLYICIPRRSEVGCTDLGVVMQRQAIYSKRQPFTIPWTGIVWLQQRISGSCACLWKTTLFSSLTASVELYLCTLGRGYVGWTVLVQRLLISSQHEPKVLKHRMSWPVYPHNSYKQDGRHSGNLHCETKAISTLHNNCWNELYLCIWKLVGVLVWVFLCRDS